MLCHASCCVKKDAGARVWEQPSRANGAPLFPPVCCTIYHQTHSCAAPRWTAICRFLRSTAHVLRQPQPTIPTTTAVLHSQDLTQSVWGFSRDDAIKFIGRYQKEV